MVDTTLVVTGAIGVLGAVAGSAVAVWITLRVQRPRPIVIISKIDVTSRDIPPAASVTPVNSLITRCDDCPFTHMKPLPVSPSVQESDYVRFLEAASRDLEAFTERLPTYTTIARDLKNLLLASNWTKFEDYWAHHQREFSAYLETETIGGRFEFSSTESSYQGKKAFGKISTTDLKLDDEVMSMVSLATLSNPRNIIITTRDRDHPQYQRSLEFCQRLVRAIGYHNATDLNEVLDHLENAETTWSASLRQLKADLDDEIKKHHRIRIEGKLGNSGGSPFSVLSTAQVRVGLRGRPTKSVNPAGPARFLSPRHVDFATQVKATTGDWDSPLTVAPGEVASFICVSESLAAMAGTNIETSLRSGVDTFRLMLDAVGSFGTSVGRVTSNSQPFSTS